MLMLIDQGCTKHQGRQLAIDADAAELMRDLLYNLHRKGEFYTFICEHGHTHCLSIQNQALKVAEFEALTSLRNTGYFGGGKFRPAVGEN
jgi:hypothetical protein